MPWPVRSSLQCNGQRTGGGNRCLAFYYRCNIFSHATAIQDKETLSLQRRAVQLHAAKANTESGHQVVLPPLTERSVALPLCRNARLPSPYLLRKPPQPGPHAYVSYHLSDFFLPIFSLLEWECLVYTCPSVLRKHITYLVSQVHSWKGILPRDDSYLSLTHI